MRGECAQRLCTFPAGLATRHAQVDDAPLREQRQVARLGEQAVPVETRLHGEHLALVITLRACRAAYRIGSLQHAQRLIAADEIHRRKGFLQVGFELFGLELHVSLIGYRPRFTFR